MKWERLAIRPGCFLVGDEAGKQPHPRFDDLPTASVWWGRQAAECATVSTQWWMWTESVGVEQCLQPASGSQVASSEKRTSPHGGKRAVYGTAGQRTGRPIATVRKDQGRKLLHIDSCGAVYT